MVKNGLNSLRNSTSNLSLRPSSSETGSNAATRQQVADLNARIAQLRARDDPAPAPVAGASESARKSAVYVSYFSKEADDPLREEAQTAQYRRADGTSYQRTDDGTISSISPPMQYYPSPPGGHLSWGNTLAGSREVARPFAHPYVYPPADWAAPPAGPPPPPSQSYPFSTPAPFGALSPWAKRDVPANEETPEKSLFEKYNESLQEQYNKPKGGLITKGLVRDGNALKSPEAYTQPFCDFLTENPTVWHAVSYFEKKLEKAGFKKVWSLDLN